MTQQTSPAVIEQMLIEHASKHGPLFIEDIEDLFSALRAAPAIEGEPVAWRYRDAWGRWAYCEALDNKAGPTVITEKQPLYLYAHHPGGAVTDAAREWQPIETAPKDGTDILAYGRAEYDGTLYAKGRHVCWWEGDAITGFWSGRDATCDYRVTHWMPLPPPPAALQSTTDGEDGK